MLITGAATTPAKACESGAEPEHEGKQHINIDAERRDHLAVINASSEGRANQRAVDHQNERDRDRETNRDDKQTIKRIFYPQHRNTAPQNSGGEML